MSASVDHFTLFGLAPRFAIDRGALEAAYMRVQGQVHPDRFASGTPAERRVAMQWATQANEAYRTLRDDGRRAAYLCERGGAPIDAESNTAMPAGFLMQQLEWREALDELRAQGGRADALLVEVESAREATLQKLGAAIDLEHDLPHGAGLVRQLMFIDKFRAEVKSVADAQSPHAVGG